MEFIIGICDDNPQQLSMLRNQLKDHEGGETFFIVESTDPAAFLEKMRTAKPSLVFLDIDMGGMNGIQLGDKLKTLYPEIIIIYLTAYENYALEAFRVRAFHYLIKPISSEEFGRVLTEALQCIRSSSTAMPEKSFPVQVRGEFISLPYSRIFCFEKVGHRIKIHGADRDIYYYGDLRGLLAGLKGGPFFQCHQGYVVNIDKVRSFRDKTLFLEGDHAVPVSRTHIESVRERLAQRLFEGRDVL